MPTRREFLSKAAVVTSGLSLSAPRMSTATIRNPSSATKPLSILLLGGTGFIGPHFVRAALDRGHKVSVFNRGRSQTDLPSKVERLIGDRDGDLHSIENREWDSVIDLATYGPLWVRTLGEALRQRARHYTFISTIDVYKHRSSNLYGTDEQSETLEYEVGLDPYSHSSPELVTAAGKQYCGKDDSLEACALKARQYGPLKVLCEREAERQFAGRTLIVRPGYMVGEGDPQARFTYWLARIEKGGEILAPGDPLQPVQFIDVRDVAEWVIRMAEKGETGIYNALGPGNSMSMCEMLGGIRGLFGNPMKLTWVSIPWIGDQDIVDSEAAAWAIWRFSRDDACKSDRAIAKGLSYRPLSATAFDTLKWYKSESVVDQQGIATGFKVDDLSTLKAHAIVTPWTEIIEHEKEILARWRVHQARL
jgi:2'-hydroxyisoflavone reductase